MLEKQYRILPEDEKRAATAQDASMEIGVILGDFPELTRAVSPGT